MDAVLSPPPPVDDMMVMPSKGTTGQCFTFCLTSSGRFVGYDFQKGYRIRNYDLSYPIWRDESHESRLFFMECRNIKKKQHGLLAAMMSSEQYTERQKKKATDKGWIFSCDLVVVEGLVHDKSTNSFFVNLHVLKKNKAIKVFAEESNISQAIAQYFNAISLPVKNVKLVYLNTIMGDQNLLHPSYRNQSFLVQHIQKLPSFVEVECSIDSCDIWFRSYNKKLPTPIQQIQSKQRFRIYKHQFVKTRWRNLPWNHQQCPADLMITTEDYKPDFQLNATQGKQKVYLVPYLFGWRKSIISFAPITPRQYSQLKKIGGCFQKKMYRKILRELMAQNGFDIVSVLRIIPGLKICSKNNGYVSGQGWTDHQTYSGCIVSHFITEKNLYSSLPGPLESTDINGIYLMRLTRNVPDFHLPSGCVTVFRGYQWPYESNVSDSVFHLLSMTYGEKGLLRSSVPHEGNFEMIGKRTSSQSTGSLVALPLKTSDHQYYRSSMDCSLLPLARGPINSLQQQSLKVAYTSGESLMCLYRKLCKVDVLKELCEQTLITQKHFCNSVHIDRCFLDDEYATKVLNCSSLKERDEKYLRNLNHFMESKGKESLPKSTTCAWTLRSDCSRGSQLFQYFVGSSSGFAFDISSYVTKSLEIVGATFHSSLFEHCTSVPIWVSSDGSQVSFLPDDNNNYNFAWGSNGKKK